MVPKAGARNKRPGRKCPRCNLQPELQLKPCNHYVCYDHFLGDDLLKGAKAKKNCPCCYRVIKDWVEVEQFRPYCTAPLCLCHPLDSTWNKNTPRDSDSQWPKMYGNMEDMNGTNGDYVGNDGGCYNEPNGTNFYMAPETDDFPILHNDQRGFHAAYLPQPGSVDAGYGDASTVNTTVGNSTTPTAGNQSSNTSYAASSYATAPSNNVYGTDSGNGHPGGTFPSLGAMDKFRGRGAMNAQMQRNGGGFNPNAPRYVPSAMREDSTGDLIVRPESSVSNRTFMTQVDRPFMYGGHIMAPTPRRFHPQATGNGLNGLASGPGAIGNHLENSMRMSDPRDNDSVVGLNSQNGAMAPYSDGGSSRGCAPSSQYLASEIMSGATESPFDFKVRKYTQPTRQALPTMGPMRFEDTKMFGVIANQQSLTNAEIVQPRPPQSLPNSPNPDWLDLAVRGLMKPALDEAFRSLPLIDLTSTINPPTGGVVRVSDIPYASSKNELTAFINRQAQILRLPQGSPYHAVHIMMERESGKTLDCFIEFETPQEAHRVVSQMQQRLDEGKTLKVGNRNVTVRLSNQDELMRDLFPRAKHVIWSNGQPSIDHTGREYYQNSPAEGFKGFLHPEELHAMRKHATYFDRAAFASKSPCRTWEVMISILNKYPWYATDLVSVRERREIFECTGALIRGLCEKLNDPNPTWDRPLDLTPALLQELVAVALACPGFSEKQKAWVIRFVRNAGFESMATAQHINVTVGGNHPLSAFWPFTALSILPGTEPKLIDYYASLFREASAALKPTSAGGPGSLEALQKMRTTGYPTTGPLGDFTVNYGGDPDSKTMDQVAKCEYVKIEQLLGMVCRPDGRNGPSSQANSIGPEYTTGNGSASSSSAGAQSAF